MQPSTLTRREYKGKIYVKNIGKMHVGFDSGFGLEENHSRSTTLDSNPRCDCLWYPRKPKWAEKKKIKKGGVLNALRDPKALKVHKIENFFDSDFGICIISLLDMSKY